ncbi:LysR family transcriptional regulator [Pelagibius litoralis]|uniref:LysR family transcriptional regulator n=1 Tax=Pelagibius litoralis TaxID=374515 RepID=A0A967KF23_9PROT|nr:LysR family transcriptional regulator [Pelagibius litoralis]NIA69346.1 LysR family transcriptional regulator [Pelagibius litoralis]
MPVNPDGPLDVSIRALRVLVAVDEAGSMARAAERLGASAAAVSQQIANLESFARTRLLDRSERPIRPTPAGALLLSHARKVLMAVAEAQAQMMELNLSSLPQLRFAVIDDFDASITPRLINALHGAHPTTAFSTVSGRSDSITDLFVRREADIAITGLPPEDPSSYDVLPLLAETFALVAARGVLDGEAPLLAQLQQKPFVHHHEKMPIGRLVEQHLRRHRFSAERRFSFEASRSILAMVAMVGGWTLGTPLNILDSARFSDEVEILPSPFTRLTRSVYLVARRGELGGLPVTVAALIRGLLEETVVPGLSRFAPMPEELFEILAEPARPAASAPAAAEC